MVKVKSLVSFLSKGRFASVSVKQFGKKLQVRESTTPKETTIWWENYTTEREANIRLVEIVQTTIKEYTKLKEYYQGQNCNLVVYLTDHYGKEYATTIF